MSPSHVARRCEDAGVIQETAGREIARVSLELLAHPDISLPRLEAVDGANVVQTSTSYKAARRGIGTSHHPARPQWDGMDLGNDDEGREEGKVMRRGKEGVK